MDPILQILNEHLMPGWTEELNKPSVFFRTGWIEEMRLHTNRCEIQGCWLLSRVHTAYTHPPKEKP